MLQIDISGGSFFSGWEVAAVIALIASFGIIGIAFAIGIGFQYEDLEEWAKKELYEIFISALIIGVLISFIAIMSGISFNLAGGDPIGIAHNCLNLMLFDTSQVFLSLYNYNFYISAVSTLMLGFAIPITIPEVVTIRFGSFVAPEAGFEGLSTGIDTMFNLIDAMMALIIAQEVILDFISLVMITYFLPLGVLMRTFPLTRVAGSTIIAVVIGAYIVYPLSIIYVTQLYNSFKATVSPGQPDNPLGNLKFGVVSIPSWNITYPVQAIGYMMQNFVIISAGFILSAIITLSSIRSLAEALGGDPDLFGLMRLI